MPKYGTGELVHFRDSEISVSVIPRMSVTIKTDNLSGKVTGVVDCGKDETEYHVDVNMPAKGVVLKVKVKESALLSNSEYVQKIIDDLMKKGEEFKKRIFPSDKPDSYGWLKSFMEPVAIYGRIQNDLKPLRITTEFSELLKKWEDERKRKHVPYAFYPLSSIEARFNNHFFGVDLGVAGGDKSAASVVDKKMSKSRCVKLLESYRAEREKVKKGRKFERCLRDSVVDEALERAIELLKGGTE